jgi:hypothetical protein
MACSGTTLPFTFTLNWFVNWELSGRIYVWKGLFMHFLLSKICLFFNSLEGRAMAQAVSRRPLTAEVRFRAWLSPCVICCGRSDTGTGFSPSSSVFPCQCHSSMTPYSYNTWSMISRPGLWPQFRDVVSPCRHERVYFLMSLFYLVYYLSSFPMAKNKDFLFQNPVNMHIKIFR